MNVCPHCQGDLKAIRVLKAGAFSYSVVGGFRADGVLIKWRGDGHVMIGQIMAARGAAVSEANLRLSTATGAHKGTNIIAAQLSKLKRALTSLGYEWPVERKGGDGWVWTGPDVSEWFFSAHQA